MSQHNPSRSTPQPLEHDYGVTPGDIIRFELNARGLTQADLAARAGTSAKHLNQVIQDAVPLSVDTALRIERTLGVPATVLTQADAVNQANKHRDKARRSLSGYRAWFDHFPIATLLELGAVKATTSIETKIEDLLVYLGVADPDAFDAVYGQAALSFRRSQRWAVNPYVTAMWLRSAELKADALEVSRYDKSAFSSLLDGLRELTLVPLAKAFPLLQERCAGAGVAVVFVPGIEGTRASAAVRWLGPERPVIVLSERGKYEDSLWFSFFHEAGHILLHPRRKALIELGEDDDEDGGETDANDFAKKVLLRGRYRELLKLDTRDQLEAFSRDLEVHPGLPACIWAYDRDGDAWRAASKLRRRLESSALS